MTETDFILRYGHGLISIRRSDTWLKAQLTGWPCCERHAEKRVTLKPRHTSHAELLYEKQKFFQST